MDTLGEFRMNYKNILLMLFVIGMFQLVSSQQIYQENSNVDLKIPCFNNNSYCSSNSNCNVTIIKFDGITIINNGKMSYNNAYHNYTLNTTNTATSGEYRVSIICDDNGIRGHSTFEFIITPTGKSISISSAIIQGLILLLMFGVTIFFLMFAGTTEQPGVKLFFNVLGYITMFLAVGTGYILIQSSEVQSNLSFTMEALIFIVGIVFIIIMLFIMINQTKHALQLMQIKKGFGSGYDDSLF